LEKNLGLIGNLIHVVLGAQHPLTMHYRLLGQAFTKQFHNQLHYEMDMRRIIKASCHNAPEGHAQLYTFATALCASYHTALRLLLHVVAPHHDLLVNNGASLHSRHLGPHDRFIVVGYFH
jgi:hypothetical protein